jgi:hypothetical protein
MGDRRQPDARYGAGDRLVIAVAATEVISGCVYHLVTERDQAINIKVGLVPNLVQCHGFGAPQ